MKKKSQLPYLTALVSKLAPKVGARVVLEPEWGVASQIIYKNGTVRSVRMYSLDLNHIASSDIARDKGYAKFFMKRRGYPVASGATVYSDTWAKAIGSKKNIFYGIKYAKKSGYPLVVKPNSQSQGTEVSVVFTEKELKKSLLRIFKIDKIAIIERYLPGRDYRIVVLDGDIISAYERIPLSITGDGKRSIINLLKRKQRKFILDNRDTKIDFSDTRIKSKLKQQKFSFGSILPIGQKVYLLDNANLSAGGDSIDVTDKMHSDFRKIAVKLTRDMGLRIAGVDIMVQKGDITLKPQRDSFYIIEINAAPGLDHYVTTGNAQKRAVEAMYLKILKALGKKD